MKKHLLLALALLAPLAAAAETPQRVVRVYDGDTLTTRELGTVRLAGIDAPEMGHRARCPRERALAIEARDYLRFRTAEGVTLTRRPGDRDREKWGRPLRQAWALDGGNIGAELVAQGLAGVYGGRGPRPDWCQPGR